MRGRRLAGRARPAGATALLAAALGGGLASACGAPEDDASLTPDLVLQRELGLAPDERVLTVTITGGDREVTDPPELTVTGGAWVQFVSGDRLIHEVSFDADSLGPAPLAFLRRTRQMHSPPLLERDARFVLTFVGAPPGRYPYVVRGNARDGRGVVVVPQTGER